MKEIISHVVLALKHNDLKIPIVFGKLLACVPFSLRPYVGKLYRKTKNEIRQYEKYNVASRKDYIFKKMYSIVDYAINNITFYKEFYTEKGFTIDQLKSFDDISKIPIIDKNDLLKYPLEQRSNDNVGKFKVNTGGSTGHTLTFYSQPKKIGKTWAHIHSMWSNLGFKPSDIRMLFVGQNKVTNGAEYEFARHSISIDIYKPFDEIADKIIILLRKSNCKYLHGYPSVIAEFAEYCETNSELLNLLRGKLKGVFLCSEYPYPMYRDKIEQVFNVQTQSFYGHTEGCVMAYETSKKFEFKPFQTYGYAEVIPDENGHFSLIGTAYDNEASPLIRYNTHDLVDNPVIEDGILQSFSIYEGRSGQFVCDSDGKKISVTGLIMGRHHPLFDFCKHVQLTQISPGVVKIYYVLKEGSLIEHPEDMFDASNVKISFAFERRESPLRTVNGKINLLI